MEHHRYVELIGIAAGILGMRGETDPRGADLGFVAIVDVVINRRCHEQAGVDVLRGEVVLVVVDPQRAQGFADIAAHAGGVELGIGILQSAAVSRPLVDTGIQIGVVVIPEMTGNVVIQRAAVALRWRMVVVHVAAGGRSAEAEGRHGIKGCGRQFVVNAGHRRAAVAEPHYRARYAAAVTVDTRGAAGKFARQETPGGLAGGASRHVGVPDMFVLNLANFVEITRRSQQAFVLVGAIPALVRQLALGVGIGGAQLGMLVQQMQLGIELVVRRGGRFAAAQEHVVAQAGNAAAHAFHRDCRRQLSEAAELVLERRGARADDVLAGNRAGIGEGGAQAQTFDRQQHAGGRAQYTELHQAATVETFAGEFALYFHRALDKAALLAAEHESSLKGLFIKQNKNRYELLGAKYAYMQLINFAFIIFFILHGLDVFFNNNCKYNNNDNNP